MTLNVVWECYRSCKGRKCVHLKRKSVKLLVFVPLKLKMMALSFYTTPATIRESKVTDCNKGVQFFIWTKRQTIVKVFSSLFGSFGRPFIGVQFS